MDIKEIFKIINGISKEASKYELRKYKEILSAEYTKFLIEKNILFFYRNNFAPSLIFYFDNNIYFLSLINSSDKENSPEGNRIKLKPTLFSFYSILDKNKTLYLAELLLEN